MNSNHSEESIVYYHGTKADLKTMKDHLQKLKDNGIEAVED